MSRLDGTVAPRLAAAGLTFYLVACSLLVDPPQLQRCSSPHQEVRCEGDDLVRCEEGWEQRIQCPEGCAEGRCRGTPPDAGTADLADAGPLDHDRADATEGCLPWSGTWSFSTPTPVTELNTASAESSPHLMGDGLTLYFASSRPGGAGKNDIYVATRKDSSAAFSSITSYSSVNTEHQENGLLVTEDGLGAILSTTRPGGPGQADLWFATRTNTTKPFASADFAPIPGVNTAQPEHDPFLSDDELHFYYLVTDWKEGVGGQDLVVVSRTSKSADFGPPALVPGVNTQYNEDNPSLTADGLVILFGSDRPGSLGNKDIWYATRVDTSAAFSQPKRLPTVNTAYDDRESFVTPDGCELYFASDRPGGAGKLDIYHSRFVRSQ